MSRNWKTLITRCQINEQNDDAEMCPEKKQEQTLSYVILCDNRDAGWLVSFLRFFERRETVEDQDLE